MIPVEIRLKIKEKVVEKYFEKSESFIHNRYLDYCCGYSLAEKHSPIELSQQKDEGVAGSPSPEAIDFAKRMIALKWTKETNVNIVAGNWQAGYIFGKIDGSKEQEGDAIIFAEWMELEGYRIKGMDNEQRTKLYQLYKSQQ